ncbi:hypothetical protein [Actinacidiphila oryziradicis]|uniref:hypothetical protein n=1 Tax=Actinacidiphila oryziradicis TaxID=2571141 RepID=UPI00145FB5C7|nr:hypothetical protein [Actinacidiphila oryziradicis]
MVAKLRRTVIAARFLPTRPAHPACPPGLPTRPAHPACPPGLPTRPGQPTDQEIRAVQQAWADASLDYTA